MRFIGLDVHKRVVPACVRDADGVPLDAIGTWGAVVALPFKT